MRVEGVSTFATSRTLLHGRVEAARAAAHVAQEEAAAHLADDDDDDKEVSKEAASTQYAPWSGPGDTGDRRSAARRTLATPWLAAYS